MFNRSECNKCKRKVSLKYDFCPYCGSSLNSNSKKEDWGMLGKNDDVNELNKSNSLFGNISEDLMNKMLGGAMRMLQREMQKQMKNKNVKPERNFRLMINGKEVNLNGLPVRKVVKNEIKPIRLPSIFSKGNEDKFLKLPREEPNTNVRRLSDKIIYEIEMKDIESIKDVVIVRLENSLEVKAVSKDKSYFKVIPLNLPILNYNLLQEKLVLEFGVK